MPSQSQALRQVIKQKLHYRRQRFLLHLKEEVSTLKFMNTIFYYTLLPLAAIIIGFIIYLRIFKKKEALQNIAKSINPDQKNDSFKTTLNHEAQKKKTKYFPLTIPVAKNMIKTDDQKKPRQTKFKIKSIPKTVNLKWLDIDRFLSLIEKEINVVNSGYFKGFSMNNGLIYTQLQLVSDTVLIMAAESKNEKLLARGAGKKQRRNIECSITNILRQKNLIPDFIVEGYPGAPFSLKNRQGKQILIGYYTPMKNRAFQTPLADIEKRKKKSKLLLEIAEVEPLIRQK